jgi:hypothetical protein
MNNYALWKSVCRCDEVAVLLNCHVLLVLTVGNCATLQRAIDQQSVARIVGAKRSIGN